MRIGAAKYTLFSVLKRQQVQIFWILASECYWISLNVDGTMVLYCAH